MFGIYRSSEFIVGTNANGETVFRSIWKDDKGNRYVAHLLKDGTACVFTIDEYTRDLIRWFVEDEAA